MSPPPTTSQKGKAVRDGFGYPLKDLCVLHLTDHRGSFCARLLADLGAQVIRVERLGGEPTRTHLQTMGVPAGMVHDARQLAEDPQHIHRKFFLQSESDNAHFPLPFDVAPLLTERDASGQWRDAPQAGEANSYVFRQLLGITEKEYLGYTREGIIGFETPYPYRYPLTNECG